MNRLFEHKEHYVRLVGIAVAGLVLFLVVRGFAIPDDFGKYGHYRAGALDLNRERPMKFAGHRACADCHGDIVEKKGAGAHRGVNCETCHGALAEHVTAQSEGKGGPMAKPPKPEAAKLCLDCHRALNGRPARFPQVDPKDHNDGASCDGCHDVHSPGMDSEPAATAAPAPEGGAK